MPPEPHRRPLLDHPRRVDVVQALCPKEKGKAVMLVEAKETILGIVILVYGIDYPEEETGGTTITRPMTAFTSVTF